MSRSSFLPPAPAAIRTRAAMPHDATGAPLAGGPYHYPQLAAAGLWSTPTDLARFAMSLQASAQGRGGQVPLPATASAMLALVKNQYGLGLELAGEGAVQSFAHGGSNKGYKTALFAYAGTGEGAVVMTNGDAGSDLASALIRAIGVEDGWPTNRTVVRRAVDLPAAFRAPAGREICHQRPGRFRANGKGRRIDVLDHQRSGVRLYAQSHADFFVLAQPLELHFDSVGQAGGNLVTKSFDVRFDVVR